MNVGQLEAFDNGAVVTAAMLKEAKIIRKTLDGVKVLGNGELTKKLTVEAVSYTHLDVYKRQGLCDPHQGLQAHRVL